MGLAAVKNPSPELLEVLKRHGIGNPLAYRMLLSLAVDPDKDMLESFWDTVKPQVDFNKLFTSSFAKATSKVDGEHRFAISENALPVGLNSAEVHTLIVGASDTGKTICQELLLLSAMRKGHVVWMFSRADDVTRMIRVRRDVLYVDPGMRDDCGLRLNFLRLMNKEIFVTLFRDAYTVADGSEGMLQEALGTLQRGNPDANIHDVYYFIRALKLPRGGRIVNYQEGLLTRLRGLLESPVGRLCDCARGHEEEIQSRNVIFNFGQLTLAQQKLLVGSLVHILYAGNIQNGRCTY
jgi:hypothetical protein